MRRLGALRDLGRRVQLRIDRLHLGRWVMPYLVVVLTVLLGLTLLGVNQASQDRADTIHDQAATLRSALVEGCKRQNTLRRSNRIFYRHQLKQTRLLLGEFFPNLAPHRLRTITRRQSRFFRREIQRSHKVDCDAVYPAV